MSAFQISIKNLNHTATVLRKYMREVRPQSFASMYPLFVRLQKQAREAFDFTYDAPDIEEYARSEKIERFGFNN